MTKGCPSCDRDLTYPGAPGHECYTYEEHAARIAANKEPRPYTKESGAGRMDIYGIEWFACDPYPTWFHYDNEGNLVHPDDGEYGEPEWPDEKFVEWQERLFTAVEKAIRAVDELEVGWSGKHLTLPVDADAIAGYLCHDPNVLRLIR